MFSCYDQFQPKELNLSQSQEITTLRIKEVDCDFTVQPLQSRKAKKHWVGSTTWQSHAPATSPTKQKHVYSPSYLKQLHCQPLPSWPKACKAQIAKTVWKKTLTLPKLFKGKISLETGYSDTKQALTSMLLRPHALPFQSHTQFSRPRSHSQNDQQTTMQSKLNRTARMYLQLSSTTKDQLPIAFSKFPNVPRWGRKIGTNVPIVKCVLQGANRDSIGGASCEFVAFPLLKGAGRHASTTT